MEGGLEGEKRLEGNWEGGYLVGKVDDEVVRGVDHVLRLGTVICEGEDQLGYLKYSPFFLWFLGNHKAAESPRFLEFRYTFYNFRCFFEIIKDLPSYSYPILSRTVV